MSESDIILFINNCDLLFGDFDNWNKRKTFKNLFNKKAKQNNLYTKDTMKKHIQMFIHIMKWIYKIMWNRDSNVDNDFVPKCLYKIINYKDPDWNKHGYIFTEDLMKFKSIRSIVKQQITKIMVYV